MTDTMIINGHVVEVVDPKLSASAGTHDHGGAIDISALASTRMTRQMQISVMKIDTQMLDLLFGARQARQSFYLLTEALVSRLPSEPVRPRGRAAVGYRRARRRYGRAVRRWRRAGSPTKLVHRTYLPHVHATIDESQTLHAHVVTATATERTAP